MGNVLESLAIERAWFLEGGSRELEEGGRVVGRSGRTYNAHGGNGVAACCGGVEDGFRLVVLERAHGGFRRMFTSKWLLGRCIVILLGALPNDQYQKWGAEEC